MKIVIELEIPNNFDLVAVEREAKLRLAMRETGFSSLTNLEKLGITTFLALTKIALGKKKTTVKTKKKSRACAQHE